MLTNTVARLVKVAGLNIIGRMAEEDWLTDADNLMKANKSAHAGRLPDTAKISHRQIATLLILCLIFLAAIHTDAQAGIYYEDFHVIPGEMTVYFSADTQEEITGSMLKVTLGSCELPVIGVEKESSNETTYLILTDISGSAKSYTEFASKAAQRLIAGMSPGDNAACMTFADGLYGCEFTQDKSKLMLQADSIRHTNEFTNLYRSISGALDLLDQDPSVHSQRCMTVISDGGDNFSRTAGLRSLADKIKELGIPVHIISVNKTLPWNLRELSDASANGTIQNFPLEQADTDHATKAAEHILDAARTKTNFAARVSLNSLISTNLEDTLSLQIDADGEASGDSRELGAERLAEIRNGIHNSLSVTGLHVEGDVLTLGFDTDYTGRLDASSFLLQIEEFPLEITEQNGTMLLAPVTKNTELAKALRTRDGCYVHLQASTHNGSLEAKYKLMPTQKKSVLKSASTLPDTLLAALASQPAFLPLAALAAIAILYFYYWRQTALPTYYILTLTERGGGQYSGRFAKQVFLGPSEGKATICLDYPGVEKRHCKIYKKKKALYIKNLSKNRHSATLNGKYLTRPQKLVAESVLNIGSATLSVSWKTTHQR